MGQHAAILAVLEYDAASADVMMTILIVRALSSQDFRDLPKSSGFCSIAFEFHLDLTKLGMRITKWMWCCIMKGIGHEASLPQVEPVKMILSLGSTKLQNASKTIETIMIGLYILVG